MKHVRLELDDELHRRLKVAAAEEGVSLRALIVSRLDGPVFEGGVNRPAVPRVAEAARGVLRDSGGSTARVPNIEVEPRFKDV